MSNIKSPTTYQKQLDILKSRGCVIKDEPFCLEILRSINYYRLTAYFLPFRQKNNTFKPGITFEKIVNIYYFDRELRRTLLSCIEEIEIFLRTRISYFHAHEYGADGYLNPENFSLKHNSQKFQELIKKEINNNRDSLFVKHHIEKYNGVFPVWVITELFTFGMLSRFFADLKLNDQKILARELFNTIPKNIKSYLRCVTDLRNICAHYGRLYYRIFSAIPANTGVPPEAERKLWGTIQAVKGLYPKPEAWNQTIIPELKNIFTKYDKNIELNHIAFPEDWEKLLKV